METSDSEFDELFEEELDEESQSKKKKAPRNQSSKLPEKEEGGSADEFVESDAYEEVFTQESEAPKRRNRPIAKKSKPVGKKKIHEKEMRRVDMDQSEPSDEEVESETRKVTIGDGEDFVPLWDEFESDFTKRKEFLPPPGFKYAKKSKYSFKKLVEVQKRKVEAERFDRVQTYMDAIDKMEFDAELRAVLPGDCYVGKPVFRRFAGMKSGIEGTITRFTEGGKKVTIQYDDGEVETITDLSLLQAVEHMKEAEMSESAREVDFWKRILVVLNDPGFNFDTKGYDILSRLETPDIQVPDLFKFWFSKLNPDASLSDLSKEEKGRYANLFHSLGKDEIEHFKTLRGKLIEKQFLVLIEGIPGRLVRTVLDILYAGRVWATNTSKIVKTGLDFFRLVTYEYAKDLNTLRKTAGIQRFLSMKMATATFRNMDPPTKIYYNTLAKRMKDFEESLAQQVDGLYVTQAMKQDERFEEFKLKKMEEILMAIKILEASKKSLQRHRQVDMHRRRLEEKYATVLHGIGSVAPILRSPRVLEEFPLREDVLGENEIGTLKPFTGRTLTLSREDHDVDDITTRTTKPKTHVMRRVTNKDMDRSCHSCLVIGRSSKATQVCKTCKDILPNNGFNSPEVSSAAGWFCERCSIGHLADPNSLFPILRFEPKRRLLELDREWRKRVKRNKREESLFYKSLAENRSATRLEPSLEEDSMNKNVDSFDFKSEAVQIQSRN